MLLHAGQVSVQSRGIRNVKTWRIDDSGQVVGMELVCVYAIFIGIMSDSPMRNKVYRLLQWNSLLACDGCTLIGLKGDLDCTKFFG